MASKRRNASDHRSARESAIREAASGALVSALRPLSALALEAGLSIEDVYQLLRLAAVKQQIDSAANESLAPSISGIAAVTGIPRSEVSKLLKRSVPSMRVNRINEQITNSVLVAWREDPRFTTEDGQPASLVMYGRGRTFERLAELHGRGIPTRALLDELRRTKSVSVGQDQIVRQNAGVAIDRGVTVAGMQAIGNRVAELATTMLHNTRSTDDARLVSNASKKVPSDRLPLLRREITKLTEQHLSEVRELLSRHAQAPSKKANEAVLSVTTFCFEDIAAEQTASGRKRKNYRRSI